MACLKSRRLVVWVVWFVGGVWPHRGLFGCVWLVGLVLWVFVLCVVSGWQVEWSACACYVCACACGALCGVGSCVAVCVAGAGCACGVHMPCCAPCPAIPPACAGCRGVCVPCHHVPCLCVPRAWPVRASPYAGSAYVLGMRIPRVLHCPACHYPQVVQHAYVVTLCPSVRLAELVAPIAHCARPLR